LQLVTDKIDIDLVTVTAYEVGGSRVLVPQRIEPARRAQGMSDAAVSARQSGPQTEGSAEFRSAIDQAPIEVRNDLARLVDWAESLQTKGLARPLTRRGTTGVTILKPVMALDPVALVTINCDTKSVYMQFYRSAFERRAPGTIERVEGILSTRLVQGNATRTFPDSLLEVLADAYREAAVA
jgi:hypothetical protein